MQMVMQRLLEHKSFVIVAIIYTLLLTVGSLIDTGKAITTPQNFDKVLHLSAYFGLGLLWMLWVVFKKPKVINRRRKMRLIALCAVLYGIFIEVLQGVFTSYRIPDMWDMLANTIGVALAMGVVLLLMKNTRMLKTNF